MIETIFTTVFKLAPDAIIVVNKEGKIILSNLQAKKLFGYEAEELRGMQVEELMPGSYRQHHNTHRDHYATQPKIREMGKGTELVALRKDGTEFSAEISLSPITVQDELFVSAAIRDVSDKIKILSQLKDQQQQLDSDNKRLVNFAYTVSHNLRSHAGNLSMMLHFFEEAESLHEKNEILERLKAISNGLTNTVKHLNEVASSVQKENVTKEVINLRSYVDSTEQILAGDIKEFSGQIINNVSPAINLSYVAAYMESIILNLISNGIKYRHPERNPTIIFDTLWSDNQLALRITDNGIGIDLKAHGHTIFGFRKTFHGNSNAQGIGLFITKNQVESLGGRIAIESEPGKGTVITIFFAEETYQFPDKSQPAL